MFGFWRFLSDSIKVECLAIQFVILSPSPLVILREPFACCHPERSEESDTAQDKLREESFALLRTASRDPSLRSG